jgi:putative nucleotidyltransferase with HDIG domain
MPFFSQLLFPGARRRVVTTIAVVLAAPVVLFALLHRVPRLDVLFESVTFHVVVVSAIAACALGVALFAAASAARSHDASLVFLAIGCLGVGGAMLGHGLTTPGVAGMPVNVWVGRLPQLALTAFAACLLIAQAPRDAWVMRSVARHAWPTTLAAAAVLSVGVVLVVVDAARGGAVHPLPGEAYVLDALGLCTAAALVGVGLSHWRRWRLGGDRVQLALVFAAWMGAHSEVSLHLGRMWQLSWWDYHALLLAGFGGAIYAVVVGALRARDRHADLATIFRKDLLSHIQRGYPEALTALVAATEARDAYTRGHSRRVTELSLALGQRLGLRADALRRLAWGAELHDIGKIGIPDYILNKDGPLDTDERALIEQHPVIGWEIARQARSLQAILDVVRSHHERIDGRGYPDGLSGDAIPLPARIVAVADVWDALTSTRSYRPAWPIDRALEIMVEGRGTQFDERCLDAFVAHLEREGITVPA